MSRWRTLAMVIGGVIGIGVAAVVIMLEGPLPAWARIAGVALGALGGMSVADTFYEIFTTGR